MVLAELELTNFRNHQSRTLEFAPNITLIRGQNAVGKTNILEAIHMLSLGKSFRAEREVNVMRWGASMTRLRGIVDDVNLDITMAQDALQGVARKRYTVNGVPKRMMDFGGILKTVLFWPETLGLVTGSPGIRRRYMDGVLIQVDREYRRNIQSYEKGIRQRNKVLENIHGGTASRSHLMFWDNLLCRAGGYITDCRERFLEFVNAYRIPGVDFKVLYDKSTITPTRLEEYSRAEIAAMTTLIGPHRDDFQLMTKVGSDQDFRNIREYGSRGEQRLIVLWLKLAELHYVTSQSQERPVLLLDDIFSEFDEPHREMVWALIKNQQAILAAADLHAIPPVHRLSVRVVELP